MENSRNGGFGGSFDEQGEIENVLEAKLDGWKILKDKSGAKDSQSEGNESSDHEESVISIEEVVMATKMNNGGFDFQQQINVRGSGYGSLPSVQPQDNGGNGNDQGDGGMAGVQQMQFSRSQALNNLGASKDKTQVGSAISLSLILIGILKTILTIGPNGMKFYIPMLYLVSITLSLQLIAGLISIYITMKRNFFSQYQGNLWRYCGKFCCPWCFSPKLPNSYYSLCMLDYSNEKMPLISITGTKNNIVTLGDEENIGCCHGRFCNNTGTYEPFEIEIFHQHNKWKSEETRALFEVEKAEIEIESSKAVVNNLKIKLQEIQNKTTDANCNEESIRKCIQNENDNIASLQKRKGVFEEYLQLGTILQKNVDKLRCKHVYMQASCLQNILCVLVYIIVALNTFIIAFGVIPNHGSLYHGSFYNNTLN